MYIKAFWRDNTRSLQGSDRFQLTTLFSCLALFITWPFRFSHLAWICLWHDAKTASVCISSIIQSHSFSASHSRKCVGHRSFWMQHICSLGGRNSFRLWREGRVLHRDEYLFRNFSIKYFLTAAHPELYYSFCTTPVWPWLKRGAECGF